MRLDLEPLEERLMPSFGPLTPWHYSPSNSPDDPVSVGFNLVAVSSPGQLVLVPPDCKALVMLNQTGGVTPGFLAAVAPYVGNPKVFGFYLADEPNPAMVPANNLKAESDWIHANDPGAKTFAVLGAGPFFPFGPQYTPSNTDIDLVGLDPYPVRTWGYHPEYLPLAVLTAEWFDGWSCDQIVPVYQSFGGAGSFAQPSALEVQVDLAIWGILTPHPAFDYTYSWGDWSGVSLMDRPDLQAVFRIHNA